MIDPGCRTNQYCFHSCRYRSLRKPKLHDLERGPKSSARDGVGLWIDARLIPASKHTKGGRWWWANTTRGFASMVIEFATHSASYPYNAGLPPKSNDLHDCQVRYSDPPPGRLTLPWRSLGWLTPQHGTEFHSFCFCFAEGPRLPAGARVLARVVRTKECNQTCLA